MKHIDKMKIFEGDVVASKTTVDKLSDQLGLACIKEINGGLDLKILTSKTRAAVVEEIVNHFINDDKHFDQDSRMMYKRNKNQVVRAIIKTIME